MKHNRYFLYVDGTATMALVEEIDWALDNRPDVYYYMRPNWFTSSGRSTRSKWVLGKDVPDHIKLLKTLME